jgi:hypothetical protein
MKGGYHYKVNKFGITSETPEKNIYSHVCEAGQYADMFFERGFESVDRAQQRKAYLQQVQSGAGIYSRRS